VKRGVIIVAGGKGLRIGGDLPKQFIPLQSKPVLMRTLEVFHRWDPLAQIVLVLPEAHRSYWEMLYRELNCSIPYQVVTGGETRFQSVQNGIKEVNDCEFIGIHDGVRPFVAPEVIEACFRKAEEKGAAIPVVPLTETIREKTGEQNRAAERSNFCIVQTPQVFRRDWLLEAYAQPYQPEFTDDSTVVESSGHSIHLVDGNLENIKITTQVDLMYAKLLSEP
jgi:2-C-methyl-D-erythritol 4-phosphate cytidylyltransferase